MPTSAPVVRGPAALLAVAVLLSACVGGSGGPTRSTSPAPEPHPTGALYGRVLLADRTPALATAHLHQLHLVEGLAIIATLGLACLITPCGVSAKVSPETGGYSFRATKEYVPDLYVSASSRGEPLAGARTGVTFRDGPDPQRVPDLVFWEPRVEASATAAEVRLSWPDGLAGVPGGDGVRYSVLVRPATPGGRTDLIATDISATGTVLDGRLLEDRPAQVVLAAEARATVAGQQVRYLYQAPGRPIPPSAAPPSRGLPCLADDSQRRLRPTGTACPLTDGELSRNAEVLLPGECSAASDHTCRVEHHRLCVDLGTPRPVSLVVVRTPFRPDGEETVVELSADGERFTPVGQLGSSGDRGAERQTYPVAVDPTRAARIVCVRRTGDRGFSGAKLSEISVW